jgi:NADPH2:quinone reductase
MRSRCHPNTHKGHTVKATRIVIDTPGDSSVLRREEIELAAPAPGEVLVRHTAIGVNFIDIQHRTGRYKLPRYPAPIGMEASGVIEALGPGVTDFAVGDRVVYSSPPVGAYADRRCIAVERLVPLPGDISDDVAAAAFNKGITAHYLIHTTYPVAAGQTILVHAAAGGVGSLLCQWAAHHGATVIGTVSTQAKAQSASAHSCHHPIVYHGDDFVDEVRRLTGGAGVPVVFDSVGRDTFEGSLRCLAPRGTLVTFGTASGPIPPLDLFRLNEMGSLYVTSPGYLTHTAGRAQLLWRANDVFAALREGIIKLDIGATYALADAAQAHRDLQDRKTIGASILRP